MTPPTLPPLIQALCKPHLHGGAEAGVVETHISWVLLAGETAYKIKKPVGFGFLDFSTLALRQKFCEEEIRLNRRLAPFLYCGVVAITGNPEEPAFDGQGPVLEYAVKMKRFDDACLADRLLAQNRITPAQMDGLARTLAEFHGKAPRAGTGGPLGQPEGILAAAEHNFDILLQCPGDDLQRIKDLQSWTRAEFQRLQTVIEGRNQAGFVRECHGDLHSGNLVLIDGKLIPFECIEFSAELRWIDCISEMAFIFMDFDERGRPGLAWRLLNRYLEFSGDYLGLQVFNFYRVYRALVRAKVATLSQAQAVEPNEHARLQAQCQQYLAYALDATQPISPALLITHGFSGSGKSRAALALAERLPAIRIASDIERKRLAGLEALERSGSAPDQGIYTAAMTHQTYGLLLAHAEVLLTAGFNVVLDATYLHVLHRCHCRALATRLGVRFFLLDFPTPPPGLAESITQRLARGDDPSEASLATLAAQFANADPLDAQEKSLTLTFDASGNAKMDDIIRRVSA